MATSVRAGLHQLLILSIPGADWTMIEARRPDEQRHAQSALVILNIPRKSAREQSAHFIESISWFKITNLRLLTIVGAPRDHEAF
jgi:hypothetical protein